MTVRILFLGEGTSDSGLTTHVRRIVTGHGVDVVITDPLVDRLPPPPRRTIEAKLQAVKDLGGRYDLLVIHRDADRDGRAGTEVTRQADIDLREVLPNGKTSPTGLNHLRIGWPSGSSSRNDHNSHR